MSSSVFVINQPPNTNADVSRPLLELFQAYVGQGAAPFKHQAETFRLVEEDSEVFLVAGTAAGKTLAIAIPLFHKLAAGHIRKVLLMYPTIALMEDQRRVMDRLAELTGLEVSQIQGGMNRSQLIAALNKPVILATPDAIYWFFRKNIKYGGLLVYALALIDEFVLDEAHLFNGLMLRNFEHLWQRIRTLAEMLGRSPRLHILTATPTESLRRLNKGVQVTGKSKCQDVTVEFRACGHFDRGDAMVAAIGESLTVGRRKVLVVCNSARLAHQLFEKFRVDATTDLPVKHQLRFGRVQLDELLQWLKLAGVEEEILDSLRRRSLPEEDVILRNLPANARVSLPLEDLIAGVTAILERQVWRIKRVLWEQSQQPGETWESLLHNRPLPCTILGVLREHIQAVSDLESQQALVDQWLADTLEVLGAATSEQIVCQAPKFATLQQTLAIACGENLAELVTGRLIHEVKVNPNWTDAPLHRLGKRSIHLSSLVWTVEKGQMERIRELVQVGIDAGNIKAECRHIGFWKGTDVPVIVYSGSMSKHARSGLIDAFADLDRAVLISTSAVEVGVDFAADSLITEECEGNGFLQRFGRVGRHGNESKALVLVTGDLAAHWSDLDGKSLSREDFSARVCATFPQRNYATSSTLVDAGHHLVNEQLGRIGIRLNQTPDLIAAHPLADQLRAAEISVGFGLRSTLPQITLKDGVTKDPFYMLRYVDDHDLRPADSPFEIAQANIWFTGLIFQKARFNVMVDLRTTLQASRIWFKMANGGLRIAKTQPGIGKEYARKMGEHFQQSGEWHPWLSSNFLLLHGDVYLQRTDFGFDYPTPEPVCDDEQNPLFIASQNYLVLLGWQDAEEGRISIASSPIAGWEEIHYDWDGMPFNNALVLLEQTAGACFTAYKELLNYADRRLQG